MKIATYDRDGTEVTLTLKPREAVTQRFGFIGTIGGGKTYAATKLAETMLDAGAQIVAIDPVGVWYGLRAKGKGKHGGPGYNIPVFGGLHGDVPLEVGAGAIIADLIVDQNISAVIDLSQFEFDSDRAKFCTDFGRRFFFRKNQKPSAVHVFIEEAQEILPEEPQSNEVRMRHTFVRMSKLGRNYGIGMSLITQRPQDVSKKALNLCEFVMVFKLSGPHERAAIKRWLMDKGAVDDVTDTLPRLSVGVCRAISREWLELNNTIHILPKKTADVSSTPQHGTRKIKARDLSSIDLAGLRTKMAATIEKAKADDPKELKREIQTLRADLATANRKLGTAKTPPAAVQKTVIKQVGARHAQKIKTAADKIDAAVKLALETSKQLRGILSPAPAAAPALPERNRFMLQPRPAKGPPDIVAKSTPASPPLAATGDGSLPKGERKLAIAIAQNGDRGATRNSLAGLTGYKRKSCNEYVSRLKRAGVVEDRDDGRLYGTPHGFAMLGKFERLPEGEELLKHWLASLPEGEKKVLAAIYSGLHNRDAIADATGLKPKSVNEYLSRLKRREIIVREGKGENGQIRVAPTLE